MKILFNGDSNVAGEELRDRSKSMAGVIAQNYNAEYVNLGYSGGSNDRIYDSTIDYLRNNPAPDLIVIGWTEHGREQWYYNNEFHEVNNLGVGNALPNEFKNRFQFWKENIQRDGERFRVMGIYWHNKIFNLHTILRENNIPHYFFNAFHHYKHKEHEKLDWNNNFLNPYDKDLCYVNWCMDHGYQEITPGWYHFDEDAHLAWANLLLKNISDYKII